MSVDLKVTLGTVNYTDWLHVTACKVSTPSVVAWETWINVPVTNYNFIIPGLDPENYYIRYYDAPTNVALGSLIAEQLVNALTSEFIYEKRFYTVDGAGPYDPANGDDHITDPYLIGKTISEVFKEGFRPLEPQVDYTFDDTDGTVSTAITGNTLATDEKMIIEVKYSAGTVASTPGGLYIGTLTVTAGTQTLLAADRNKRIRLKGSAATQVITLATLSALAVEDGFYFDNSVGGTAKQVKLLSQGGDRIFYNGFDIASDEFAEFWVSKGQHLLIKKFDDDYYEVITDFKGVCVGERIAAGFKAHPLMITENGQLMDGDEWPLMWWWIQNVLPNTHYYITDTVTGSFTADATKPGQFAVHSTLKKWRMPSTMALMERGLADFETYGGDTANRPVDYPGGFMAQMVPRHSHSIKSTNSAASSNSNADPVRGVGIGDVPTRGQAGSNNTIGETGGDENRVKNFGVIYARKMG